MLLGIVSLIIFVLLMGISFCLRLLASGLTITNKALDTTRDENEQQNFGRDAIGFSATLLRRTARFFSFIAKFFLGIGSFGTVVVGVLFMVLVVSVATYSVILKDDLQNAISNRQEDTVDKCESEAVGGYWEELDFCFEASARAKVYTDVCAITAVSSDQYKLVYENPNFYIDEYGFSRLKDEDLGVDFFCIAWSKALFTQVGDKFRVQLEDENGTRTVYVAMIDQRADGHSRPDGKGKSSRCYPTDTDAIMEFYIDCDTAYKNHPELGQGSTYTPPGGTSKYPATTHKYYLGGGLDKIVLDNPEHDFRGHATKIEHYLGKTGTEYKSVTEFDTDAKVSKEKYADGEVSEKRSNACEKKNDTVSTNGRVIWVGDSRTVQLHNSAVANKQWDDEKDITNEELAKGSMGIAYFQETSIPALKGIVKDGDTIVINYGVNDLGRGVNIESITNNYSNLVNQIAEDYPKAQVIYMSVNPVTDASRYVDDQTVVEYNKAIKPKLSSKIKYIDTYSKLIESEWMTKEIDTEGVHYSNASDGYYHCYGMIYDSIRNGGKSTMTTNGISINIDTRYYSRAEDGIYGTEKGLEEVPMSVSQPFKMTSDSFAMGRAWQVNNPMGVCPLPEGYSDSLAQQLQPRWPSGELVKGLFTTRVDIPIDHSIISYTTASGVVKEAFLEYLDPKTGFVQISEVSGKNEKYAGYSAPYYESVERFIKKRNATFNCMFQPIGDGH